MISKDTLLNSCYRLNVYCTQNSYVETFLDVMVFVEPLKALCHRAESP